MESANGETQRSCRRQWRKSAQRFSRRLFCCSCLCGEKDPLQEQEKEINGGPLHPHLDQLGSGEKEAIQITVEDLGIVNTGFSLFDEDPLIPRNSVARSASSVSACPRALKKKRLKPLSSLPIQPRAEPAITPSNGEDDEQEEEDLLLYESGTDSTPASGSLLTPPVINLIPPTPSDVVDDYQFFEINSEESVAHTSGSDGSLAADDQESFDEKMESVKAEESKEGCILDERKDNAESEAEPEEGQSDELGEQGQAMLVKKGDTEKTQSGLSCSSYQVACLPEYPQKNIASVDVNTLDILHISTPEDREQLLSAIYNELHPPSTTTQRIDSLLESLGPNNVETFTATLVSMTKSKSSPHVSCLSMNRRSLRNNSQSHMAQRNSQLIEITINASERIVHLRTPKETTVGKIMESCVKMLGVTEDKSVFTMKEKQGSPEELSPDRLIGTLLTSSSENRQLELYLCKTVQELHHGLVAFCSELKNMDGDVKVDRLGSAELKQKLELVHSQLNDKRQNLQALRDNINNFTAHKKKQLEIRLLEKMKLNCQVFKEEISIVHLNRQAAHLQNALQESYIKEKAQKKTLAIGSLSQLVSPQSPAMLLVVQENQSPDGHYGFMCRYREEGGLVVVKVDNSNLHVDDRLVEVNGVPVVNSTQEELTDLLQQGASAQIVVLRQPPPGLASPLSLQHMVSPDPVQTICPERNVVAMETPPQRKVMAI
nr:PREDICTED: uncharacterized protein LOC103376483 [Stegastes partitus]